MRQARAGERRAHLAPEDGGENDRAKMTFARAVAAVLSPALSPIGDRQATPCLGRSR